MQIIVFSRVLKFNIIGIFYSLPNRDLIFIWSKLQLKSNPSKQVFVDHCYQLLRIATNVRVIFPFMKVIKDEVSSVCFYLLHHSFGNQLKKREVMFIFCNDRFWWTVKKGRTLKNFVRLQNEL